MMFLSFSYTGKLRMAFVIAFAELYKSLQNHHYFFYMAIYTDATAAEINETLEQAWKAFHVYRAISLKQRADFMHAIATALQAKADEIIPVAMKETNLPEPRLKNEFTRTIFQLNSYADACEQGNWLEARIDTAMPNRNPPKPDLRKM